MITYFFMPPLNKISGGMGVIAQLANHLQAASFKVAIVTSGSVPDNLQLDAEIDMLKMGDVSPLPEDRWIVPEGWPNALAPGLRHGAKCAVYVQNWAFLHGKLPEDATWNRLPVRMLAVSEPVSLFIKETTGHTAPVIPPAIDPKIFYEGEPAPQRRVRIAWMPRKNRALVRQIRDIFEARLILSGEKLPSWQEISGMTPGETADAMRNSQIFFASGFPEGFGLPPLEAMACGCIVAGFTGFGGWAYMKQGLTGENTWGYSNDKTPWGPNGFYVSDGDIIGGVRALEAAYNLLQTGGSRYQEMREAGKRAASWFNPERQKSMVLDVWKDGLFWD